MESVADRRLKAIHRHFTAVSDELLPPLRTNAAAAAEFFQSEGYSVTLPEKLNTGKWNVHRSARSPLTLVSRFSDHPEVGTLHDNFVCTVERYPDHKYLGSRVRVDGTIGEYKWMTYGEASNARSAIGSALQTYGLLKGARIGIYFINRPEWIIVDHACSAYSFVSVPLYDTLGPDAVNYIVNHADVQAIFCVPATLNSLMGFLSEMPNVRLIVVVDGVVESLPSLPGTCGAKVTTFSKLLNEGRINMKPHCPPSPDDIATICYTSGTTGTPKGAMLTHESFIANAAGASFSASLYPTDVYLSFLPLAHIYERAMQVVCAHYGAAIGFYQGDNLKLMDDSVVLRPTVFCSVPRLYNRIYAGITNAVKSSGGLRERLFNLAFNSKKQALMNGQNPSPIWDKLVFNKIKEKLGGRVRVMYSGASPISPDVLDFLRVCFGCQVFEGYGMTETSCVITMNDPGDLSSGHVGAPSLACEIKLVDVPEMNYTSDDQPYPRGEICVRGPIVFRGYLKDEVQTREMIDEEGWLHTGDIGLWLQGGRLKIIDRKKNIFKLAQGEYIAPEKIENVYAKCKFVAQCFVYGDSFKSCLVAVVCVEPDVLKGWATAEGIKYQDLGQLCRHPRARAAVLADMDAVGREAGLRGFEFAKAVTLVPEPLTVEGGLLTPTMKIKRLQAKEYFAKAISEMYYTISKADSAVHKL